MPQRSGSGGGFAEAFRKRIAEAQSQMSNSQLQSKGPGYGSQAARVAASPSLPNWQQTPTFNMLKEGGTNPTLDAEGDLTSIINGKKVANWSPDHILRDKPGYGPPENYAFMTMNTETGAGGPNIMDYVNNLMASKADGSFINATGSGVATSSLASQYAVPAWAVGIDQQSRSNDKAMAEAGYSDLSKTMGIDSDGNYVRFDFGKKIIYLAPGNNPEDFPQYEKLPNKSAGRDVYTLKTETPETPNTESALMNHLYRGPLDYRQISESSNQKQRMMELLQSGVNYRNAGIDEPQPKGFHQVNAPGEPAVGLRSYLADYWAQQLPGLFGGNPTVTPTPTASLVPPGVDKTMVDSVDRRERNKKYWQDQYDRANKTSDKGKREK